MDAVFKKDYNVLPGACDSAGLLSYQGAFSCFMDIAAQHAEVLGVGFAHLLERGLFWLTVKTKVVFLRRPGLAEAAVLATWPETPGRIRCCRSYRMTQGEELLLCGKTEWALVETAGGRMTPPAAIFPEGLQFPSLSACDAAFTHVPDHFEDIEPYAEYRVRSTDIDVGGHMNNAAYLTAMMGTFSRRELSEMRIHTIDALFRSPCFEGDELIWQRKPSPAGLSVRAQCGGKTVFLASFDLTPESPGE